MSTDKSNQRPDKPPPPLVYRLFGPIAQFVKALLQMAIGSVAVYVILRHVLANQSDPVDVTLKFVFSSIGLALVLAAAIELAFTLFTHGPDEALDPLMLGVAAALLLQLGKVDAFDYRQGIAALLYVAALAGLFAIRKHLSEEVHVGGMKEWKRGLTAIGGAFLRVCSRVRARWPSRRRPSDDRVASQREPE